MYRRGQCAGMIDTDYSSIQILREYTQVDERALIGFQGVRCAFPGPSTHALVGRICYIAMDIREKGDQMPLTEAQFKGRTAPLLNATIGQHLDEVAARDPDHPVLVMQGCWGDPERTAETIDKDGWLHSGDLGEMDKNGG